MAGNRSTQEINIIKEVNDFIKITNGGPINLKGKNGFEIKDIVRLVEDPLGDSSAADLIVSTTSGSNYKISCKQYNPINFVGSGLKSFVEDKNNLQMTRMMKKWMNKVLGKTTAYLNSYINSYKNKMISRITDYLLDDIRNNSVKTKILDEITKDKIEYEYKKFLSLVIPDVYIEIPDSMRKEIFTASNIGGPINYYILNGMANSITTEIQSKTISINDCDILSVSQMVTMGETIYLLIRKRRADQTFEFKDNKGNIIKDKNGFLRLFSKSLKKTDIGARVQIREQSQLPKKLQEEIFNTNSGTTKKSNSIIIKIN